ncbi:MAG: cadmium-translocating P-type ATPase [Ruminococcus sp.]|nr:cadmium-translocating P-type ATPase [Ruminococcus sp.]
MSRKQKRNVFRIAFAAVLFVVVWALPTDGVVRLLTFLVPYAIVGYDVVFEAFRNIAHGQVFDENFLMSVATIGAFFVADYPEAVAVMLFYQVGELFQSIAVGKSRKSIAALMDIRPDYANVLRDGDVKTVSPEEVEIGEIIEIKPGEKIPLDAVVTKGETTVNTAALTGESVPVTCRVGDAVISGSVNQNGLIEARVTSVFGESTVSKILDLVENATSKKAKSENFITRFAKYYTPCVVFAALALALIPPLLFKQPFSVWVTRALTFLVVSCPCALVVSVPLTFFCGIGGASRQGVLIKGANYLETLSKAETVVFDKTGTLTNGTFTVVAIHPQQISERELLDLTATAESVSSHPIATSILKAYGEPIDKTRIGNIEEFSGRGIHAVIDGKSVYVGNGVLMQSVGVDFHECKTVGTTVHIAVDGLYAGHIVIADTVKPDAKSAVEQLKASGIRKTVMLTGDSDAVGQAVAKELGMDEAYTQLMPDDKVEKTEKLLAEKNTKSTLAFVGDGINDAPVLARADVGIAMGALGSDAAIEAADVVLMDDKPAKLVTALKISRKTMRILRQNIVFALSVKAVVLLLSAFGLASMWVAVFADVGVMILAVCNAVRAMRWKK